MESDISLSVRLLRDKNSKTKRQFRVDEWADKENKRLRQSGQEYTSRNEEIHPAVQMTPLEDSPCGPQCTKTGCLLPEERLFEIFSQFWESGSYDVQTGILLRLMRKTFVANRTTNIDDSRKSATWLYFLLNSEGMELPVCRSNFLRTLAVSEERIKVLQRKIGSGHLYFKDNRGRHNNRPQRLEDDVREAINEHIDSYPKYESHYERAHGDPLRLYLEPGVTITMMFENFVAVYGERAASLSWAYRQQIKASNVRTGTPKSDTCSKCDELNNNIKSLSARMDQQSQDELFELHLTQTEHHLNKEAGYSGMQADIVRSRNDESYVVVSVDLQGVLFSPILTVPEYYYSRKFSSHNLAIVNARTDQATMCFWDCTEGRKGSCEVGSCILKYCRTKYQPLNGNETRRFVIWSDRCAGQNNNQFLLLLFRYLISIRLFTTIEQKFLTTGHTFLPADRHFALVEKKKQQSNIFKPADWIEVIQNANQHMPNVIQKMNFDDFKRIADLGRLYRIPGSLKVSQVKWIRLEHNFPNTIYSKVEIDSESWIEHRVTRSLSMTNFVFVQEYQDFIPLAIPLIHDLQKLIRWIPEEHKDSWAFLNVFDFVNE